ncbi:MAG: hypothetical protein HQL21_03300 [Candidatus Omnitrophica bacterium]|nr:hypothetical protein [Candidatus Omnitrophota bacterium]
MKWFFCTNEASLAKDDFFQLVQVSLLSAKKNTTLEPHLVYEGTFDQRTNWLQEQGVTIHSHRLSFFEDITNHEGRGALLRVEIPRLLKEQGREDKFILYTDCDVLFLSDPPLDNFKPAFFSGGPQQDKENVSQCNSGVLLMNIDNLEAVYEGFVQFIVKNRESIVERRAWDQWAYNNYFRNKWDRLPLEYNWKPYWEKNEAAVIVHFHGPKHTDYEDAVRRKSRPNLLDLFDRDPQAFKRYTEIARSYLG